MSVSKHGGVEMNEQMVETLEQEAIDNGSRYTKGQSSTVEDVTVFSRWHRDERKTDGGYWDFTYIIGTGTVGRHDAVDGDAYQERTERLAAECARINKERNG